MKYAVSDAALGGQFERVRSWRGLAMACIAVVCTTLTAFAQVQPPVNDVTIAAGSISRRPRLAKTPPPSIRMDVNRVLVPVLVTDPTDHQVQGLGKMDFRLFEDGVEQQLTEFFHDESPVSVAVVFDVSNSMRDKIDESRQAISAFLRMSPIEDEFCLITVSDQPQMAHAFTSSAEEIESELAGIQPKGWTALYDGMYLGMNYLKRSARSRRVLLVLSDGGDNNSRYTESETKNLIRESDVRIFTVSVLGGSRSLERLAEESGGRAYRVRKLDELPEMALTLSREIHSEYVLGFAPGQQNRDGKYHIVKVEVMQPAESPKLRAWWRHGYYAPLQ